MYKSRLLVNLAALSAMMVLFFVNLSRAQSIQGEWRINKLILNSSNQEYTLTSNSSEKYDNNNRLILNEDFSFFVGHSPQCGVDCGVSANGVYSLTDEHHIQFRIDTVSYFRHCEGWNKETEFPIETGLYYIQRGENEINLVKSNGDLEQDKLNIRYSDTIEAHIERSLKYANLLVEIRPSSEMESSPENIASLCLDSNGRSDYKLLYSKDFDYRNTVVLVEIDGHLKSIFCNLTGSNENSLIYSVSFFDEQILNQYQASVTEINNIKRFKIEKIQRQDEKKQEIALIYRKKNEIKKVTIEKNDRYGKTIVDYYFENEEPIYMKISHDFVYYEQQAFSSKEFYLTADRGVISKEISKADFYGHGVGNDEYYRYLKQLETLIGND